MKLNGHSWIAGRWSLDESQVFSGENPRTSERIDPAFYEASRDEIDEALAQASKVFDAYRKTSPEQRAELLLTFAREVAAAKEELIQRAGWETGLPAGKLEAEWKRVIWQAELFAKMVREQEWQRPICNLGNPFREGSPKPDVRQLLQPVGPVVVFGASNFPLAISVGGTDTVSALAAGCPVVVKAHPAHPGTSELVASCMIRALDQCHLPASVFSMIQGTSHETGAALVTHPETAAVAFTGSLRGGRALFDLASRRRCPIPFYGELGSVNPVFVLPDKLKREHGNFAKAFVQSLTMGVGQYCTNPGIVVLSNRNGIEELYREIEALVSQVEPQTMLHRGIKKAFDLGVKRWSKTQGVHLVASGIQEKDPLANQAMTQVYATTFENFMQLEALREEVFGPASLIVVCEGDDEVLDLASSFGGQLTASIHGTAKDLLHVEPLLRVLERKVGRVIFDGFGTGIEVCEAMHHGGPYPASTHAGYTSIGHQSIYRFVKPVSYQNAPQTLLPKVLKSENPDGIQRFVDGIWTRESL